MSINENAPCPCGFGSPYVSCCGPIHAGSPAPTALQLMRSRYSAFTLGLSGYLMETWHSLTRPTDLKLDTETRFLRLLVEESTGGGPFDTDGTVTFTAVGRTPEGRFEQHERSRFTRENGAWRYVDGTP